MKIYIFLIFATSIHSFVPNALVGHTLNQAYNNFWNGAVGGKGYWGDTPLKNQNIFDSKFDNKGIDSIYKLDKYSPYAS